MLGAGAPAGADLLAWLLDGLELEAAVVVTPSMSGRAALPLLARDPQRFDGLVALAPVGIESLPAGFASDTPALLIWGSEDRVVPPERGQELVAGLARGRLVVLEGAGHPAYLDQPERFHAELVDFLDAIPRPRRASRSSSDR